MSEATEATAAPQDAPAPEPEKFVSDERVQNAISAVRKVIRLLGNRGPTPQETKQIPMFVDIALRTDERYRRDRAAFPRNEAGHAFEAGKTYRSADGWFMFKVDRIVDGVALGHQSQIIEGHGYLPTQVVPVWRSEMAEGSWAEVGE